MEALDFVGVSGQHIDMISVGNFDWEGSVPRHCCWLHLIFYSLFLRGGMLYPYRIILAEG